VGEGVELDLVDGVAGVADQLAEEDLFMRIERVGDDVQKLLQLGLELQLLGRGGRSRHPDSPSTTDPRCPGASPEITINVRSSRGKVGRLPARRGFDVVRGPQYHCARSMILPQRGVCS